MKRFVIYWEETFVEAENIKEAEKRAIEIQSKTSDNELIVDNIFEVW